MEQKSHSDTSYWLMKQPGNSFPKNMSSKNETFVHKFKTEILRYISNNTKSIILLLSQLIKNFCFHEPQDLLCCLSQNTTIKPHQQLIPSSPYLHKDSVLYQPAIYISSSGSPIKMLHVLLHSPTHT
jgi:hypothetical protein